MRSRAISIMLALVMGVLSPAWCCCTMAVVAGGPTDPAVAHGDHDHGHAESAPVPHRPVCGGHGDEPGSCDPGEHDDGCDCGNHDLRADLTRGAELPQPELIKIVAWPSATLLAVEYDVHTLLARHRYRHDAAMSEGNPRAQSLYARHCLLLI